jgi:hypothetical protein
MLLTLLPKTFKMAMSSRFERGIVVKAAAIPKEASIKNTTGFEKPARAAEKFGVTLNRGIRERKIRQVSIMGRASVISKIRNATSIPMVRIPARLRDSAAGIKNIIINMKTDILIPIKCFLSIGPLGVSD